ncbi:MULTISPECIES: hypothetical protein [Lysobacter]|nr:MULTISPECIES: hypothetical protein [Lysobacter]QCW24642.1 hypothetical protein FE772_02065 [Lysobacter enzymogenes]QQQ01112.1 hypothetical protein JHW41_24190 [Lysobacter enzymogenes]UZW60384.1 hypothetical protein BV903_024510 [Lysobacter enzymogenes]WMT04270.1 hypothetical protein RDV84_05375 [Lysobacter yananisis]
MLLLFGLLTKLFGLDARQAIDTGIGPLPLIDILAALVSMFLGGALARHARFRWIALLLPSAMWALTLFAVVAMAQPDSPPPMRSIGAALKYNALAIALTLAAAFAGALLGERFGRKRFGALGSDGLMRR